MSYLGNGRADEGEVITTLNVVQATHVTSDVSITTKDVVDVMVDGSNKTTNFKMTSTPNSSDKSKKNIFYILQKTLEINGFVVYITQQDGCTKQALLFCLVYSSRHVAKVCF